MRKWVISAMLMGFLLTGCGQSDFVSVVVVTQDGEEADTPGEGNTYVQLLENTHVAEVGGEPLSPDGRYEVRAEGASEHYVSGVRLPESLQIVDTTDGTVVWEDMGYLWQSALWSLDGKYLALAYARRTWNQILLFETDSWTTWQFTLPEGKVIPEYTFLSHENWGTWIDKNTIVLTVGEGGNAGESRYYVCSVSVENGNLQGSVTEEAPETRLYHYDFNHNGELETVILEGNNRLIEESSFWGLKVVEEELILWSDTAATSHAGWNNLFAVQINGEDCLLRYNPYMGQGAAGYSYQIFSLNEAGEEVLLSSSYVSFDINFGSTAHQSFDAAAIAAFLEEVHGYLEESVLLVSTESGVFRSGGSGADFREDGFFWDEFCPYDPSMTLEENVRNYQKYHMDALGIIQ